MKSNPMTQGLSDKDGPVSFNANKVAHVEACTSILDIATTIILDLSGTKSYVYTKEDPGTVLSAIDAVFNDTDPTATSCAAERARR